MERIGKSLRRRQYLLTTTAVVCGAGLAGCTGDDDGSETNTSGTEDGTADDTADILIDYKLSGVKTYEEVPDEVVEHPNPEDFLWIVVEFELTNGQFNASDIMGLTQVRAGDTGHFTRAVILTSPDNEILTSPDDESMMAEGTMGEAYYRLSEEPDNPEWDIGQLRNQHGTVEVRQR